MFLMVSPWRVRRRWRRAFAAACCFVLIVARGATEKDVAATPPSNADHSRPPQRVVELRFLGSDRPAPLAGVEVKITQGYGADQKRFGPYRTDDAGTIRASLPLGFYSLQLRSEKELPYLPVEALWNQQSRGPRPDLSLAVTASSAEKWLNGNSRPEDVEPPAPSREAPRITYRLLPACELVLRAIDAESGAGLAGARFYTENAVGEEWAHAIHAENLGARATPEDAPADALDVATDRNGDFRRLVGTNAGFTYGVDSPPPGYEETGPGEVEVEIVYGQLHAEHVFKFRRVP